MNDNTSNDIYDLLVIGGGINGAGVAADAAGRGLKVILCEKDDLANHTSSASSKLIHGGLRYLEQYEFKLVREALAEREILLKAAPHLVHPQPFILPYDKHLRPAWMIRAGLFLYDHLAKRRVLDKSKRVKLKSYPELKDSFTFGFRYLDCRTDDARLVIANAQQAQALGAKIFPRTAVLSAKRGREYWQVELERAGQRSVVQAKAIVNASGAWVVSVLREILRVDSSSRVRLVKGSHFTLPKLYEGNYAYLLQLADHRILFTIPYHDKFTLVGTTDVEFSGDPNHIEISEAEIDYMLNALGYYFKAAPQRIDINWCYSGVRALYDDASVNPSAITREYHLELDVKDNQCPVLSIFGGKITTYRILAEQVLNKLGRFFPNMKAPWTANATLPGGNLDKASLQQFNAKLAESYPAMPWGLLVRLVRCYGSNALLILGKTQDPKQLNLLTDSYFSEKELNYLVQHEWAMTVDDVVWRRTKLGLTLNQQELKKIRQLISS